jgi:V/A-type H+-transporting ATPase subunit B
VPDNTGYITEGQFYLRKGVIEPFGSLSRLKQLIIGKVTRSDHGPIMNSMIRLFAKSREVEQKLAMGFDKTEDDDRFLRYGKLFYDRFMDLKVDMGLNDALDLGWATLAECFRPDEVGIKQEFIDSHWPKDKMGEICVYVGTDQAQ